MNTSFTTTAYIHRAEQAGKSSVQCWLVTAFRLLAVAMGLIHTWAAIASHSMSEDGINYLDIGDAYMRGDWTVALNSVWSPLYSWILGPVMHLVRPSMRWEFAVVQIINFVIFVGSLLCFEFFWRQLTRCRESLVHAISDDTYVTLPEWAWTALGYALFVWASLTQIKIWVVTPDMLMAAFVYLAAGLIVRVRLGHRRYTTFVMLGMVLGMAYLAKAVMFPLALVFLALSLFSMPELRQAIPRVLTAFLIFVLFSAPFVGVISAAKGRLTFGDAGTLTYVWYVNGVPYPHWQGEPSGSGIPEHPSRRIFDNPPIYEFGTPIGGTYPIAYDPSYWHEGVVPHLDVSQLLVLIMRSATYYLDLFLRQQGGLVVIALILYWMGSSRRLNLVNVLRRWGLVVVAFAALAMYALVYVEARYIGVFVVLLWADTLANVSLPSSPASTRLLSGLGAIMVFFVLANILAFNVEGFGDLSARRSTVQAVERQARPPSWPGEVAEELHRLGIERGDKVAVIGYGFSSFWARLARVQIVAELLGNDADPFWLGDSAFRAGVIEAFAGTGARAIVAEGVPGYAALDNWHQVGDSNYYLYLLID